MTPAALSRGLRAAGITAGQTVMVHASMRKVGGRAEALVAALDEAVGRTGTWMMVYGAAPDPLGFHARTTPVDPEVGVLAEVMRRTPGTVMSDHPEGRFGARGRHAEALMVDVPWHDYFGPGSPLERLVQRGGSVLRLGSNPDTMTIYHYAEYLADVPDKIRVARFPLVRQADGTIHRRRVSCLDDSTGIAAWDDGDYFAHITHAYLATGRAQVSTVGAAVAERFDAADVVTFAARWMEQHLTRR